MATSPCRCAFSPFALAKDTDDATRPTTHAIKSILAMMMTHE